MIRRRLGDDDGSAMLLGLPGVAVAAVAALLVVELAAYLIAAARVQGAADAAALAAAAVAHPQGDQTGDPTSAARRVATAWDARLDTCACVRGRREVRVTVSIPVRASLVTRFAGRRVSAAARATLVPPPGRARPP